MSIEIIDTIKPKNQGTFPVVEAKDVKVDNNDKRLDTALGEKASQAEVENARESAKSGAEYSTLSDRINAMEYFVSVKEFGAKGDSTTDDTSAFRTAITYCSENKLRLFVPHGNYRITDTLDIPRGFILFGETIMFANISSKLILDSTEDIPLLNLGNGTNEEHGVRITDIYLVNGEYSSTPEENIKNTAINFNYVSEFLFENLYIIGFKIGIKARNMTITTFRGLTMYYCNTAFDWTGSSTTYIENSNIFETYLVFNNIGNITVRATHFESYKNFINKNNNTYLLNVSFNECSIVSTKNTTFLVSSSSISSLIFSNCAIRCNSIDVLFDCGANAEILLRYCYVFGINCYVKSTGTSLARLQIEGHKIDSKNYDGSGSDKPSNLQGTAVVVYNFNDGVYETNGGIGLSFPRRQGKAQLCIDTTTGYPAWLTSAGVYCGMQFGKTAGTRPTGVPNGYLLFDLNLHKPIWKYGDRWVDATGEYVADETNE